MLHASLRPMSVLTADPLVDALAASPGKAEIVGDRVVPLLSAGFLPHHVAAEIYVALRAHAREHGGFAATDSPGRAGAANLGVLVDLPGRGSFSPDAACSTAPPEDAMDFVTGAPVLAVEVRSKADTPEGDGEANGPRAERAIAATRADHFAAGTAAVWDVDPTDPLATVRLYTPDAPDAPAVFARADTAHAGDALPGFAVAVDVLVPPAP